LFNRHFLKEDLHPKGAKVHLLQTGAAAIASENTRGLLTISRLFVIGLDIGNKKEPDEGHVVESDERK
jgi:hypothetical protein